MAMPSSNHDSTGQEIGCSSGEATSIREWHVGQRFGEHAASSQHSLSSASSCQRDRSPLRPTHECLIRVISLCSARAVGLLIIRYPVSPAIRIVGTHQAWKMFIVKDELLITGHFDVESLVDLRSRSCPGRDHAKQVLADAELLFGFRRQHAAQGQHRLHHRDSMADVEVARRSLHVADVCG